MICQNAIDKKIIPRLIGKHPERLYDESDLQIYFNLKGKVLNKFINTGVLKVRVIPRLVNRRHLRVFLLKDNKNFLPPKKILSSHWVRDDKDGQEGYAFIPWYCFHDPKTHLKKYGISAFLKIEYGAKDH